METHKKLESIYKKVLDVLQNCDPKEMFLGTNKKMRCKMLNKKGWEKADNKLEKTREELLTFIYMKLNISERERNILVSKIRNHKYAYGNWLKYLYP